MDRVYCIILTITCFDRITILLIYFRLRAIWFPKGYDQVSHGSFGDNAQTHAGKCWLERRNVKIIFTSWNNCLKFTNSDSLLSQSPPKPGCPYALFLQISISHSLCEERKLIKDGFHYNHLSITICCIIACFYLKLNIPNYFNHSLCDMASKLLVWSSWWSFIPETLSIFPLKLGCL